MQRSVRHTACVIINVSARVAGVWKESCTRTSTFHSIDFAISEVYFVVSWASCVGRPDPRDIQESNRVANSEGPRGPGGPYMAVLNILLPDSVSSIENISDSVYVDARTLEKLFFLVSLPLSIASRHLPQCG